jgi:hypothetical protein
LAGDRSRKRSGGVQKTNGSAVPSDEKQQLGLGAAVDGHGDNWRGPGRLNAQGRPKAVPFRTVRPGTETAGHAETIIPGSPDTKQHNRDGAEEQRSSASRDPVRRTSAGASDPTA